MPIKSSTRKTSSRRVYRRLPPTTLDESLSKGLIEEVKKNNIPMIQQLLERGANINAIDKNPHPRKTPLIYAVENNNLPLTKFLLDKGADVNLEPKDSYKPLYFAIVNKSIDVAELLLQHGANPNVAHEPNEVHGGAGGTNLGFAMKNLDYKMVDILIKYGASLNGFDTNSQDLMTLGFGFSLPLHNAIYIDFNMAKYLIKHGADVNYYDKLHQPILIEEMLRTTSQSSVEQQKAIEFLLKNGAKVNEKYNGFTPLVYLINKTLSNNIFVLPKPIVELLIKYGADPIEIIVYFKKLSISDLDNYLSKVPVNDKTQSKVLEMLDLIPETDPTEDCSKLFYIIDKFKLDRKTTVNFLQSKQPGLLCRDIKTYESKRAKLPKKSVRAFSGTQIQRKSFATVLTSFINTSTCYCLDYDFGIFDNLYIPVIRYGKGPGYGFYGKVELKDPDFTWYYIEPGSKTFLYSPRTLITKNKITAMIELNAKSILDKALYQELFERMQIRRQIGGFEGSDEDLLALLLLKQKVSVNKKSNNYLEQDYKGYYDYLYKGGALDFLDEHIQKLAVANRIDVVLMTHQAGNSGRLVSECVDVRKRSVSYGNLFYLEKQTQ
jgi:ankyrin repeat protein